MATSASLERARTGFVGIPPVEFAPDTRLWFNRKISVSWGGHKPVAPKHSGRWDNCQMPLEAAASTLATKNETTVSVATKLLKQKEILPDHMLECVCNETGHGPMHWSIKAKRFICHECERQDRNTR